MKAIERGKDSTTSVSSTMTLTLYKLFLLTTGIHFVIKPNSSAYGDRGRILLENIKRQKILLASLKT